MKQYTVTVESCQTCDKRNGGLQCTEPGGPYLGWYMMGTGYGIHPDCPLDDYREINLRNGG